MGRFVDGTSSLRVLIRPIFSLTHVKVLLHLV